MSSFIMDSKDIDESLKKIEEKRNKLRNDLNRYKVILNKEQYDLFNAILNFEVNVWHCDIIEDIFKLQIPLFAKIVKFNLKYYMFYVVSKNCDISLFYYSDEKTIKSSCDFLNKIASVSVIEDEKETRPKGLLVLEQEIYDKDFNKKRLSMMKRILKELESRDGYDRIAAALLYREIEDANDSLNFERIHDDYENEQKKILFKGSKEILDILTDEYKIILPESSSLEAFDKDFNNEHTLSLAQYASMYHNETIEEEKCVQDNEKGKVLVKQIYHSVYKGSTN